MREDSLAGVTRFLLFCTLMAGLLILLFLGWWLGSPWTPERALWEVGGWQTALSQPKSFMPSLLWLFLTAVVLVRWNNVVRPTRQLARVGAQAVTLKLQALADSLGVEMTLIPLIPATPVLPILPVLGHVPAGKAATWQFSLKTRASVPPELATLMASASALPDLTTVLTCGYWDFLLWSRGRELRVWRSIHNAERLLIGAQQDPALQAGLTNVLQELDDDLPAEHQHKVDIQALLAAAGAGPTTTTQMRLYLQTAWGYIYDRRDTSYNALDGYHSQSLFMLVAAGTLLCLVAAGSSAGVLLAGAVGGILSRLQVARQPQSFVHVVATDYGASWVPLFLSPVLGALAAWGGSLLLSGLNIKVGASEIGLTPASSPASACTETVVCLFGVTTATLAAAFVLGFSERYLMGLVAKLDTVRDPSSKS